MQLLKPNKKDRPTLTSDTYAYVEVLQIIAEIYSTTFRKNLKSLKRLKSRG